MKKPFINFAGRLINAAQIAEIEKADDYNGKGLPAIILRQVSYFPGQFPGQYPHEVFDTEQARDKRYNQLARLLAR